MRDPQTGAGGLAIAARFALCRKTEPRGSLELLDKCPGTAPCVLFPAGHLNSRKLGFKPGQLLEMRAGEGKLEVEIAPTATALERRAFTRGRA